MCMVLFCRSLREVIFLVGEAYISDTSVLFRCYYAFVLPILEYYSCSPVWVSAAECYLQLLDLRVYLVARLCSDHSFLSLCRRRHVAGQCMLYKISTVLTQLTVYSACFRLLLPEFGIPSCGRGSSIGVWDQIAERANLQNVPIWELFPAGPG